MASKILVGSYTDLVSTLEFNPTSSPPKLKLLSAVKAGHHPSWLARHPTRKDIVIATIEQTEGTLVVLKVEENGTAAIIQSVSSGGEDPAHAKVLQTEVIAGNYSGSSIFSVPLSSPESTHPLSTATYPPIKFTGTGPNTDRQEKSHPHEVYHHPTREELIIPDLGSDKIWRLLKAEGGGGWEVDGFINIAPGSGPRHAIVHDDILYTVGELKLTLIAHALPPLPQEPVHLKTVNTLSHPLPDGSAMLAAEILLSPSSPHLLYISNRNDPSPQGDPISIFTPGKDLERVGELRTGLDHIRGMQFNSEGKYLVVGGANGGGIKVFERLEGGLEFKEVASTLEVEKPTSFLWL